MRIFAYILVIAAFIFAGYSFFVTNKNNSSVPSTVVEEEYENKTDVDDSQPVQVDSTSVFVPYWADMNAISSDESDRLLYFGISVDEEGVIKSDPGYANLDGFVESKGNKETYLTVRMLDSEINTAVLKDSSSWPTIAESIADIAEEKGFDGVVLDLEVGLIALHISPASITGFTQSLKDELTNRNIKLAMTMYGDTFYRKRPYDVKKLGEITDEMMIMAYDFHKSFGTPGPNFPLNGREGYGYDFTTMVNDFTKLVPAQKLTILFGMYGYEWNIDNENRPLKTATAVTLNQINNQYITNCTKTNCKVITDEVSAESKITYDEGDRQHVIWYENEESVARKEKLLEEKGISKIGYWAYGYY